jgi:D-alanyl-D-alanine carboxypeptidase
MQAQYRDSRRARAAGPAWRHLWAAAILIVFASAAAPGALAESQIVKGPYLVADVESGAVFEHHDALRPWYPASVSKLMTAYVTFRAIVAGEINPQSPVVISKNAAAQPPSKMGFRPGTVLTVDNALKIIMVKSANDIALALAEAVGGSEAGFAARMNAEARRLGMSRSHFVNPHGLPDARQVTSARDMAVLARALLTEFSQYRSYYNIPAIQYGKAVMKNYNSLVGRYPGTTGMKTGYICASGFNLVASARRNGKEVVAVVFGSYSGLDRAERAAALLDEGFQAGGLFGRARTSLANVASGAGFSEPLDMRPEICTDRRRQAQEEIAAEPEFKTLPNGIIVRTGGAVQQSHLGPPQYMGPPVRITLAGAAGEARTAAAPVPRTRPAAAEIPDYAGDMATAFAERPVVQAASVTETAIREPGVPKPRPRPEAAR